MKKALLSLGILFVSLFQLHSQIVGEWKWATLFDTIGAIDTEGYHMDMVVDEYDNLYFMGVFRDNDLTIGTETLINRGGYDVFVCSFDKDGNFRWARSIGSTGHEDIGGLVLDGQHLYVGGAYRNAEVFFSHSTLSLANDNHYDSFIAHYDLNGNPLEAKRVFWGSQQQRLNDIALDEFNHYLVAVGIFRTHLVHGNAVGDTITAMGEKDHFIARFDISGGFTNLAYHDARTYYSSNTSSNVKNVSNSVIGETHTGYFVTGDLFGVFKFTPTDSVYESDGKSNAMVFKLDENLDYQWSRTGGGPGYDHVNSAKGDDDGNIYFAGKYESNVRFDSTATLQTSILPGFGAQDLYVVKYNREGRLLWIRNFGDKWNDDAFGLALNNKFIEVAGNVTEGGNTNTGFIKLDHDGLLVNTGRIYGDAEDIGKAVGLDSQGNTCISGYTNSDALVFGDPVDPDTVLYNNSGSYAGFLAKYEYPLSIVRESVINVSCYGDSSGSIKLRGEFGIPPYIWSWEHNPGNTTDHADSLPAGMYVVTLTDSDSPSISVKDTIYITQHDPIVFRGAVSDLLCFGDESGSIVLDPAGGTKEFSYYWIALDGGCNLVPTHRDQADLCAGTYKVTLTDKKGGCTEDTTYVVTEPPSLEITGFNKADASGPGMCDGGTKVLVSGGTPAYSYLWSTAATTDTIMDLCGGLYSVSVTDLNGCGDSAKVSIVADVVVHAQIQVPISCKDSADGEIFALAEGGKRPYTWSWEHDAGLSDSVATDLDSGWYKVTVTDADLKSAVDSVYLPEPLRLQASKILVHPACYGLCDGSADMSISGGTKPYSLLWNTGDTIEDLSNLCPGKYNLHVEDANGCNTSSDVIIKDPPPPVKVDSFVVVEPPCFGKKKGSIFSYVSSGTAPYTYYWSNGLTTPSISLIPAGEYWLSVTDSSGCVVTDTTVLTEPALLEVSITENKSACWGLDDGILEAEASGGTEPYTWHWTPGDFTTPRITDLSPLEYCLLVTDAHNCAASLCEIVAQSSQISTQLDSIKHILCAGGMGSLGSIYVSVSGGDSPYTYVWSPSGDNTQDLIDKSAGRHSLTVTDASECIDVFADTIKDYSVPMNPLTPDQVDPRCHGSADGSVTFTVTGGAGQVTYRINPGDSSNLSGTFVNLVADSYTITAEDTNLCQLSSSALEISDPPLFEYVWDTSTWSGTEGTITIVVSGGTANYTFTLSGAGSKSVNTTDTTWTFVDLTGGDYTIEVTDSFNCATLTGSINVSVDNFLEGISILLYPNPSTGKFTIEMENGKGEDLMLEIMNLAGQVVYQKLHKYNGNPRFMEVIDMGDQAKGTYFIRLNGLPVRAKLMIE